MPFGNKDPIERIRFGMNDTKIMTNERERCYIYSDTDETVSWQDVEAHAEDAKRKSFALQMEKFKGSAHCGHIRSEGGTRYWNIVQNFWQRMRK